MTKHFLSKINVMHVVENLNAGGMENGIVNLANNFESSSFEFNICCIKKSGDLASRIYNKNTKLFTLGCDDGLNLSAVGTLSKLFKSNNVHIVHTHGWGARSMLGFLGAKMARTPLCINGEHGHIFNYKKSQRLIQQKLALYFDGFLFVSSQLQERYFRNLNIDPDNVKNLKVIHNGVDYDNFNGSRPIEGLKKEFNIKDGEVILVAIGSLKKQKNQQLIIHALERVKKNIPLIRLFIVGDGPDKISLNELSKSLSLEKNVTFLGVRHDIPELLSLADVFISSSLYTHEGLSNVILEAMSSKVPIITTRSTGTSELLEEYETGLFCDDNPEHMAKKILLLLNNNQLRIKMINNSWQNIKKSFGLKMMAENYSNYYQEVLEQKLRH